MASCCFKATDFKELESGEQIETIDSSCERSKTAFDRLDHKKLSPYKVQPPN